MDPLNLVRVWSERVQSARTAGDTDAATAVLHEVAALSADDLQPPSQALGQALGSLAASSIELPDPASVEAIFNLALRVFERASDVQVGDILATWNNLAALYTTRGAHDRWNQVAGMICRLAEHYDGPVDSTAASVFMTMGEVFRTHKSYPGMLVLYRQMQRHALAEPLLADTTRALWFERYASGLIEAGRQADVEAACERAIDTLLAWPDPPPLSIAKCAALLTERRWARGDFAGSADLLERVMALPALPEHERTEALSMAGRARHKAGEFEAASALLVRAVRRRAGIGDTDRRA